MGSGNSHQSLDPSKRRHPSHPPPPLSSSTAQQGPCVPCILTSALYGDLKWLGSSIQPAQETSTTTGPLSSQVGCFLGTRATMGIPSHDSQWDSKIPVLSQRWAPD